MLAEIIKPVVRLKRPYVDMGTRLLRRAARGDRQAFERLYTGYRRIVLEAILHQSDDADPATVRRRVQEVFAVAWRQRKSLRAGQTARQFLLQIVAEFPQPVSAGEA